ncbi:MAG: hypothetical protein U0736_17570 [Gemmataceae bacterium]
MQTPPPRQAAALIRKLALALQVAHRSRRHSPGRKPSNVLMKGGREPVIMDFGWRGWNRSGDRHLTADGTLPGTPVYMHAGTGARRSGGDGPAADVELLLA